MQAEDNARSGSKSQRTGFSMDTNYIQCAMSGRLYTDSSLGIWDEGEWISWEYIDDHLEDLSKRAEYPHADIRAIEAFETLVEAALAYYALTNRHLEIWGELGELYAEIKHGVKRHPPHHAGSDGTLDGEDIEIKTISPAKMRDQVTVKKAGNFTKLLIVKISAGYRFDSILIDRRLLRGGSGAVLKARWRDHANHGKDAPAENRFARLSEAFRASEEE